MLQHQMTLNVQLNWTTDVGVVVYVPGVVVCAEAFVSFDASGKRNKELCPYFHLNLDFFNTLVYYINTAV